MADETGSVELEFPPGLRLSKGSWTGGFEVFGRAPNWWEGGDDFLTPVASRALAQAEQAAASHVSTNPEPDAATVRALLASPRPTDWEAGIVLASRLDPPLVDELVAVVHDPSFGAMRLAAALLLSRVDPVPSELGPALVELSRSDDAWQALGAVQLFPTGGDAVVERAVELLRSGRTIPALWAPLQVLASRSEAAHARYRDLLLSTPDVEVGLLVALPVVEADPGDPEVLSAVARLLREAGDGHPLLDHLVARVPLDPALAADRRIPWRTRLAILGGGERDMPTNERSDRGRALLDAVSRCIADAAEPETFLLELLSELTVQDASHPGVSASLWSVQASHPSPFVREEARTVLRRAGEGGGGELVVVSARYGIGDDWADVTRELSEAVIGASLRRMADNSIAGDPAPGHRKRLEVEFQHRGRTHRRVVREGETLVLP